MDTQSKHESKLERLRREAEIEMRRNLDDSQPRKRSKNTKDSRSGATAGSRGAAEDGNGRGHGNGFVAVDRYRYAVVGELAAGAKGFIVTCNFRKEKSATREASRLLRRYMPAHLFPAQPEEGVQGGQQEQQDKGQEERQDQTGQPAQGAAQEERGVQEGSREAGAQQQQPEHRQGQGRRRPAGGGAEGGAADGGDSDGSISSDDEGDAGGGGGTGGGAAGVAAAADGLGGVGAAGAAPAEPSALGLAKVGCRGVVVMRLSEKAAAAVDPVGVLGSMLSDLEGKQLQPPSHCQRLIPLDSTCVLTATGLRRAVAAAAAAHRARQADGGAASQPFTYAIAYRSRLTEAPPAAAPATAATDPAATDPAPAAAAGATIGTNTGAAGEPAAPPPQQQQGPQQCQAGEAPGREVATGEAATGEAPTREAAPTEEAATAGAGSTNANGAEEAAMDGEILSDRGRIIATVAAAMGEAFGGAARVDLKKPQVAVLVETLPVAGRPFAGVSLLGPGLFSARGKLLVKPLAKNAPTHC